MKAGGEKPDKAESLIPQRPYLAGPTDQAGELADLGITPQDRREPVSMLNQLRGRGASGPGAVAQQFGVLSDDNGQLVAGIGALEALC